MNTLLLEPQRADALRDKIDRQFDRSLDYEEWLDAGYAKYGVAFYQAELEKRILLQGYAKACAANPHSDRESFLARSSEFWQRYEQVNRLWIPVDPTYSGSRGGVTLATNADFWTLTSASSRKLRVLESYIGGEATASTPLRVAVQISTGGTTPTNQTPEKFDSDSPAAAATFATTWAAQPTLSGNPLIFHAFNAFGGTDRWIAVSTDNAIYLRNTEQLSARSASGTPAVSGHAIWEEL